MIDWLLVVEVVVLVAEAKTIGKTKTNKTNQDVKRNKLIYLVATALNSIVR